MITAPIIAALLLGAVAANDDPQAVKSDGAESQETSTSEAEPKKITDRNHPEYIRCRKEPVMGSRAKFRKICMTNAEWKLAARKGNEGTREIIDSAQSGLNGAN